MLESSIPLRPVVRRTMKLAPDRRWSAAALLAQARTIIPDVGTNDVLDALNWNLSKGYVDTAFHNELEVDVWFLTARGKQLQEEA